jgi:serine/threonine-protein kinase PknG
MATRPDDVLSALGTAQQNSAELALRRLRALIELGRHTDAEQGITHLRSEHGDDWRVVWYRGLAQLAQAGAAPTALQTRVLTEAAAEAFDAIYDAFPGEAAPKLALGLCAELLGNREDAAEFYRLVWTADRGYVSAAFGLARVCLSVGDRVGAVAALESIPETSTHYVAARIAAIRARVRSRAPQEPIGADLAAGHDQLAALGLDDRRREQLSVEVLESTLGWALAGAPGHSPVVTELGTLPVKERELRFALEKSYRSLARLAERPEDRIELVERANRSRPRTWV